MTSTTSATASDRRRANAALAWSVLVVTAAAWSGFCLLLYRNGHAPSHSLLPGDVGKHYLWQAIVLCPALVTGSLILRFVVERTLRLKSASRLLRSKLTFAYATSIALALVVPDVIAYALGGFGALTRIAPLVGLALLLTSVSLIIAAIRTSLDITFSQAFVAAVAGLVVQALMLSPIIR